jgi:hypothetical protein
MRLFHIQTKGDAMTSFRFILRDGAFAWRHTSDVLATDVDCTDIPPKRAVRFMPGTQSFTHILAGVFLKCEIEWEAAEKPTRDEPGDPANAVLFSATTMGGDDITQLLSTDQQGEIEQAFLLQREDV